ncbi:MAG: SDR family oxidoreductase [Actinomycetota bacterium]|nr:SDR family oxidoreductase [Actinomycetota bacterium]
MSTDSRDFEGKIALVTGGGKGIGGAISEMLAARGATVAINFRSDAVLAQETCDRINAAGGLAKLFPADITNEQAREQLVADVKAQLGSIDLLVNNAAYTKIQDPHELTFRTWKAMFAANLDAAFHLTWLVKDDMLAKGFGGIVNISSNSAERPSSNSLAYGTTKAALNAFTARASLALAPTVRINGVSPGFTETPRVATVDEETQKQMRAGIPMGRAGTSEEIAEMVCYLFSAKGAYITGQTFSVSGGPS